MPGLTSSAEEAAVKVADKAVDEDGDNVEVVDDPGVTAGEPDHRFLWVGGGDAGNCDKGNRICIGDDGDVGDVGDQYRCSVDVVAMEDMDDAEVFEILE